MPKELEEKLKKEADKKQMSEKQKNAYVYGTMRRQGWRPRRERGKSKRQGMFNK